MNSFLKLLAEKFLSSHWGESSHSWGPEWEPVRKAVGNFLPLTHLASTWLGTSWVMVVVPRDTLSLNPHTKTAQNDPEVGIEFICLQQGPGVQNWGLGFA